MNGLAARIAASRPAPGTVELFYLAQAGAMLKTPEGTVLAVDPYLSNFLETPGGGYRRLIPPPLAPEEFAADWLIATHAHEDHLDPVLVRLAAERLPKLRFLGAPDCRKQYAALGIPAERTVILARGESAALGPVRVRATYADHGALASDAVGFLIEFEGVTIYVTGDTASRPEPILKSLAGVRPDLMMVPINPAYGNPGAEGAAELAAAVRPRAVLAAHYGMFAEHGGDPEEFRKCVRRLAPEVDAFVLSPGESLIVPTRRNGL